MPGQLHTTSLAFAGEDGRNPTLQLHRGLFKKRCMPSPHLFKQNDPLFDAAFLKWSCYYDYGY